LRGVIHHRTLITTGIGESSLAELLAPIDELLEQDTTLAFLPNVPLLRLRITARGATNREVLKRIATMEARIRAKAAKYIIGVDDDTLEAIVANILIEQKKTLAVAESCTGGMLSSRLTTISGVGEVFLGGVVSYDNSIKTDVLGVSASTIEQYGAVSEETALEMASGIRKETKADIGISITGLAGPTGGGEHKPIGTVWIALADEGGVRAYHNLFSGDRQLIRERSTVTALNLLRRLLLREAE